MLEINLSFITFIILYIIIFLITALFYRFGYKEKRIKLRFIAIFEMYLLVVFKIVILPIRIITDEVLKTEFSQDFTLGNAVQLIPLQSVKEFLEAGIYLQIVGNILLLLPLPVFLIFLLNKNNTKRVLLSSFGFCLGIEMIQLCICLCTRFSTRIFDVDDILLNSIGILLGYGFCCISKNKKIIFKAIVVVIGIGLLLGCYFFIIIRKHQYLVANY